MGISFYKESEQGIVDRLNNDYIKPIQEKLSRVPVLQKKIKDLEKTQEQQNNREKELNAKIKDFEVYKEFFKGMTREQRDALTDMRNSFARENNKKLEEQLKQQEKAQELQRAKEPVKTQDKGRDR